VVPTNLEKKGLTDDEYCTFTEKTDILFESSSSKRKKNYPSQKYSQMNIQVLTSLVV
jgi:hypothetical protein